MAFKGLPRKGTVIPEHHRPPGSINAALHELPAYREHTYDLRSTLLYMPRTRLILIPLDHVSADYWRCSVAWGDETYPHGGYDLCVSNWELQRARRVAVTRADFDGPREWVPLADPVAREVAVVIEPVVVVERDPGYVEEDGGPVGLFGTLAPKID